jgi:hypothetical protein
MKLLNSSDDILRQSGRIHESYLLQDLRKGVQIEDGDCHPEIVNGRIRFLHRHKPYTGAA